MSEHITHLSDAAFEKEVLQSQLPVLVDYWAEWCGPCKMIAPILEDISKEYAGRLRVAKLNIDDNQQTPPKYGIRGIPTLMLFKNGNVEATKVGALSKSQLTAFIDSNLYFNISLDFFTFNYLRSRAVFKIFFISCNSPSSEFSHAPIRP